uniref:Uncharacterized protein n=1 Tax=Chaetoceros debilis TaxID=122233 RepID=A0A7S3VFB1_9STRA|mmetsp:Transcript_20768/g.30625  ORF Transcript_20768/g.30625 Transcript_20768/m.30625 type:complete len:747 (-) Transcript_20768:273-2513(-)
MSEGGGELAVANHSQQLTASSHSIVSASNVGSCSVGSKQEPESRAANLRGHGKENKTYKFISTNHLDKTMPNQSNGMETMAVGSSHKTPEGNSCITKPLQPQTTITDCLSATPKEGIPSGTKIDEKTKEKLKNIVPGDNEQQPTIVVEGSVPNLVSSNSETIKALDVPTTSGASSKDGPTPYGTSSKDAKEDNMPIYNEVIPITHPIARVVTSRDVGKSRKEIDSIEPSTEHQNGLPPWKFTDSRFPLPIIGNGYKIKSSDNNDRDNEKLRDDSSHSSHVATADTNTSTKSPLQAYNQVWTDVKERVVKMKVERLFQKEKLKAPESKTGDNPNRTNGGKVKPISDESRQRVQERVEKDPETRRKVQEHFKCIINQSAITIQNDTSITGRFSKKTYKPFGFEPSTEKACMQEQYEIVKPSMGPPVAGVRVRVRIEPHGSSSVTSMGGSRGGNSNGSGSLMGSIGPYGRPRDDAGYDHINYYQAWNPVTMEFEPKKRLFDDASNSNGISSTMSDPNTHTPTRRMGLGGTTMNANGSAGARGAGGSGGLPLGAAAAGTRAALLSFMSAKTGLASALPIPPPFQAMSGGSYCMPPIPSLSNHLGTIGVSSGMFSGTTIECPRDPLINVPEKVIIQQDNNEIKTSRSKSRSRKSSSSTTKNVVSADNQVGGKRIEQVPVRKNKPKASPGRSIKKRKKTSKDYDADSSYTTDDHSSSKKMKMCATDSDDGGNTTSSTVRRSRRRAAPKNYDS